jgi:hypothetical protein
MQEALVEAMKFDLEEGNFCDTLLNKIDDNDKKKDNSTSPFAHNPMNSMYCRKKITLPVNVFYNFCYCYRSLECRFLNTHS